MDGASRRSSATPAKAPTSARRKNVDIREKVDIRELYQAGQQPENREYFRELDGPDQTRLIEQYNAEQSLPNLRLRSSRENTVAAEVTFFNWLIRLT